jgi:precorrin-3B synthase
MRGVDAGQARDLAAMLIDAGLSAGGPGDLRRNILAGPLRGLDPTEVADVTGLLGPLLDHLDADDRLDGLSAKFGVVIDGGGRWHLGDRRGDVVVSAVSGAPGAPRFEVRTAEWPVVTVDADDVAAVVHEAAVASLGRRSRPLVTARPVEPARPILTAQPIEAGRPIVTAQPSTEATSSGPGRAGPLGIGAQSDPDRRWVGAMPRLGRLDTATAESVAAVAATNGAVVRLTPWRGLVLGDIGAPDATGVLGSLAAVGLVTDERDGAAAVVACAGSGCTSGRTDAIGDATAVIEARRRRGAAPLGVHVSGCEKRCAWRAPAPVTLLAVRPGRYDVLVADGSAPGGERRLAADLEAPAAVQMAAALDTPADGPTSEPARTAR